MLNKRADKLELLRIAEAVALEKAIDKELIINSMETGIAKAAKSKFGQENEIKVSINRENGDIEIFRKLIISENPENSNTEIRLKDAIVLNQQNKDKKIGDEILQPLPAFDFGRIAAQTAKQVISFNVREAERERQFNDFKDKKDTILSGIVKRLEFGNVIVDLGRTEAIIQKNELIPRENIKAGDRIKAYCYDVRRENKGQQIFLSRAHPKFMEKLFVQEVPEIYDGLIDIKSSSRDPGSRAKICVKGIDTSLDPVGACVGMRGSRVQAVVNELQGEKIDIVNWSEDPAILVSNALSPAFIFSLGIISFFWINASAFPRSTITFPNSSRFTIPLKIEACLSLKSLNCLSLSASRTLKLITCLAVWAAILPKSNAGSGCSISSPTFLSLFC